MKAKRSNGNMEKLTVMTILFNGVQILSALVIALICLLDAEVLGKPYLRVGLVLLTVLVSWGAFMDVREAYMARRLSEEADMLEESHRNLEELNGEMRKQRHDFMNHLQVVYSLLELDEHQAAEEYLEKVYSDIKRVNRTLKTAHPAINALLAAKMSDCEARGIALELHMDSPWQNMPVPSWEICRVLGNLIDNAMDALAGTPQPAVRVALGENLQEYSLSVANNGPMIPEELRESIFQSGFSTKSAGRGMGLAIVQEIVRRNGGVMSLTSDEQETRFCIVLTKKPQASAQ